MDHLNRMVRHWFRRGATLVVGIALVCGSLWYLADQCIPPLQEGWDARSWIPTDAWIESVDFQCTHRDRQDDICRVVAAYRYSFAGKERHGTRVGLLKGDDRSVDWNRRWSDRLRGARQRKAPERVYVDPQDPDRAVLDRDTDWIDLLVLLGLPTLFLGMGVFNVGTFIVAARQSAAAYRARAGLQPAAAAAQAAPRTGTAAVRQRDCQVVSQAGRERLTPVAIAFWVIAAAASVVLIYSLSVVMRKALPQYTDILLAIVAIPIVLAYGRIRNHRAGLRIGRPILVMDPYPGAIGGEMAGQVDLALPHSDKAQWKATLACLRRGEPLGRDGAAEERIKWEVSGAPLAQPVVGRDTGPTAGDGHPLARGECGTRLAVRFAVPPGLPPSGAPARVRYLWRLTLKGGTHWPLSIERRFEIEMQPGTERSEGFRQVPVTNGAE